MNAIPRLSPAERAAVFVMLLSDVDAAALLAQLGPEELEAVGTAMCAMGDVDPGRIADLLEHDMIERLPDGRLRVSREGMAVLDAVVADLAA